MGVEYGPVMQYSTDTSEMFADMSHKIWSSFCLIEWSNSYKQSTTLNCYQSCGGAPI